MKPQQSSMPHVIAILQARMGSTRMPGKVLRELVPGKSLLACLVERLKQSETLTEIVIATSDLEQDTPIEREAAALQVQCFRGSETDVLARFVGAASVTAAGAEKSVIVRLCADSPLHDAELVDLCLNAYLEKRDQVDYVSNMHPESFPYGTAVEVFPIDVLWRLDRLTNDPQLREHVTSLVYHQPQLFRTANVEHSRDLSAYRFAVDYPEDFDFARKIYERLYKQNAQFSWLDVVNLLEEDKALLQINAVRNDRLQLADEPAGSNLHARPRL
ncbi:MAG: glycosyltransferase family protein [Candidatus Obscuribacterales bacterium]